MVTNDATLRDFEQRVAGYVQFGWTVVERQADPPRVRLVHRAPGHRRVPPDPARDTGVRVIWVDEAGEVRVERGSD